MSPGHALKALESLCCRKAFFAFIKYLTKIQSSVIQSQFLEGGLLYYVNMISWNFQKGEGSDPQPVSLDPRMLYDNVGPSRLFVI